MEDLDEIFEKSYIQYLKEVNRENNSVHLRVGLSFWIKDNYNYLLKFNPKFTERDLTVWIKKNEDQLKVILDNYIESNYDSKLWVSILFDLNENCILDNLKLGTQYDKRVEINRRVSKNRKEDSFDFKQKSIIMLDLKTGKEIQKFKSQNEAKKYLHIHSHDSYIIESCEGKRENAYGYKWKFAFSNILHEELF